MTGPSEMAQPPIRVFFSYVRSNDTAFRFIKDLQIDLQEMVKARCGRPCEVFVDKDNIPLGENWKTKIELAVQQAYFFLPFYTHEYLKSQPCREEFNTFRYTADRLKVPSLIIPIILLGFETLLDEGEDEISDYFLQHQSIDYGSAWVEGSNSPAYRKILLEVANRIIEHTPKIDEALAEEEKRQASLTSNISEAGDTLSQDLAKDTPPSDEQGLSEDTDLLSLSDNLSNQLSQLNVSLNDANTTITELGSLPSLQRPPGTTKSELTTYLIKLASEMKNPAQKLDQQGQSILSSTIAIDQDLYKFRALLENTTHDFRKDIIDEMSQELESFGEIKVVQAQLDGLLSTMSDPEALSASIRRAFHPARRGIVAIRDSIDIMLPWGGLFQPFKEERASG